MNRIEQKPRPGLALHRGARSRRDSTPLARVCAHRSATRSLPQQAGKMQAACRRQRRQPTQRRSASIKCVARLAASAACGERDVNGPSVDEFGQHVLLDCFRIMVCYRFRQQRCDPGGRMTKPRRRLTNSTFEKRAHHDRFHRCNLIQRATADRNSPSIVLHDHRRTLRAQSSSARRRLSESAPQAGIDARA